MKPPTRPIDETLRLEVLRQYDLLDTLPEQAFDDLTMLAANACEAPISLISLIDEQRQWFKSRIGWSASEMPRDISFCGHAILQRDLFLVADAARDERFVDNPLVAGDAHIRFYAGAPLVTADGYALGTLCIMDRVPRQLSRSQQEALRALGRQAMSQVEWRRQVRERVASETPPFKVFDNCPVGMAIHRWSDRTFVDINRAFTSIFGWTREEVIGRTALELQILGEDDLARLRAIREALYRLQDEEVTMRSRTGEPRHILLNTASMELHGERHAITAFIDITGRQRAEEALRQSEARVRLCVAASNIGFWDWDLATNEVHFSSEWKSQLGYAEDEISGRFEDWQSRLHPDDVEPTMYKLRAFLQNPQERYEDEFRLRHKDGSYRWFNSREDVLRDAAGKPARMLGCHIDITKRKQAEDALRASEAKYRAIFENSAVGIAGVEPSGVYAVTNRAYQRMLGYTEEELRVLSFLDLTYEEDRQVNGALYRELWEAKIPHFQYEKRYRRKDSKLIWVRTTVSLAPGSETVPRFAMAVVEDITERKRAEEKVRALRERLITTEEEERRSIARELHDDLNQKVAALSIFISNLKRHIPEQNHELRAQMDRLHEQIARLAESVRHLSHRLHPALLEYSGIAVALRSYCAEFGTINGIDLRVEASGHFEDLPPLIGLCLYRIVQEALQNVTKHSGATTAVVRLERRAGSVSLVVKDPGVGFQVSEAVTGHGLGLVSMSERVRLVNGTFHIESVPDQGTTVTVSIPL